MLLGFLSALIPFNSITNTEFRRVLISLKPGVSLPSVSTLRRLLATEYETTVKAIRDGIPEGQKVALALDGWTSGNKLAISSVIMYYISKNWELKEVQLAFEEVCGLVIRVPIYDTPKIVIANQTSAKGEGKAYRQPIGKAPGVSDASIWPYKRTCSRHHY